MSKTTTQQLHPWHAVRRTIVETILPMVALIGVAFIAAGPEIAAFVEAYWPGSPLAVWILGAVAFVAGLAGLLAKLAALPAVDRLLQHIGLGSTPKQVDDGRHAA